MPSFSRNLLCAAICALALTHITLAQLGTFFQMTDLHLDPLYVSGSAELQACHRGQGPAGKFGNRWKCDAPESLISMMPKFNPGMRPDFVVWTGDNARHDIDSQIPRTAAHIYDANWQVAAMLRTMGVPLVPSIGNNDIYPHDQLCFEVPNDPNLGNLSRAWEPFIPASQMETFKTLGSYWVKVGRAGTVVISLNTLAFYSRNLCVNGCAADQPGHRVLSWLQDTLEMARREGAPVIISGHVPPGRSFWYHNCADKYAILAEKYKNTIVGHLYAHTHQDNFALILDPYSGRPAGVANYAPSGVSTYNPAIRQYFYNTANGRLVDYTQYYSNLTEINRNEKLVWEPEYTWSIAYGYSEWSVSNWADLDAKITLGTSVREKYLIYRYVSSGLTQFSHCTPEMDALGQCVLDLDKHHNHD